MTHFGVSMFKSVGRILAAVCLGSGWLLAAGILFAAAEMLGIIEEMVE
jgi:hypothetical protein